MSFSTENKNHGDKINKEGSGGSDGVKKLVIKENPKKKPIKLGKNIEPSELKRINSVLRSRYSFYGEPPMKISEAQTSSKQRLKQFRMSQVFEREKKIQDIIESNSMYSTSMMSINKSKKKMTLDETERMVAYERERHERLIGQLKAAEARNRARIMRARYENLKQDEIDLLIESQQTALQAVRLEAFLPSIKSQKHNKKCDEPAELLNPVERHRLDALIDDTTNRLIDRRLY